MIQRVDAVFAHLRNKSDTCDKHSVILLSDQATSCRQEHLHQLRYTSNDPKGAKCCFLPDVRVRRFHQSFNLGCQISCHFWRRDCTEGAQC